MLSSTVCRAEHFTTEWYEAARSHLELEPAVRPEAYHRKAWEWCAILSALQHRGAVGPGRCGVGFAVGGEPLVSTFASLGCDVLATDMHVDLSEDRWTETGQHASGLDGLFRPTVISEEEFRSRVSFEAADMRSLDHLPRGSFDFVWSSCAFEHIGNLQDGLDFVLSSMNLLKSGGVAVHTTEYNVSSDTITAVDGNDCIYRRQDLEALMGLVALNGGRMEPVDYRPGDHRLDWDVDFPPFHRPGRPHLKFFLRGFVSTSVVIIIHKL